MKKGYIWGIILTCIYIMMVFSACNRVSRIVGLLEEGDYQKAGEIYYKKAVGNSKTEKQVTDDICTAVEQYIAAYNNGERDAAVVNAFLEEYRYVEEHPDDRLAVEREEAIREMMVKMEIYDMDGTV